ncbi:MBL fold metallo-hydrolase [Clostridium sp. D2Q-11]|uniref:MBL fold metallo-hydrolase n=1 Tax=Anaeromonas frigoriresistens TaxID=2683708 RepID=A0A942UVC4_9FIRM|nr:MBL fold metallo-hydrolase [Anaeromonas frigoriresistens]MBS4537106.1 MBL fold metallo-hydrolase [Anaeromonas frigoriresistens]
MKLTVLGNYGPFPKAGGACSGYLLEYKDTKILIDCGNGILSRLQKFCPVNKLDAIILTHLHSDHISDIFIMKYALGINKNIQKDIKTVPVYTANGDKYLIENMNYNDCFEIKFIDEDNSINIGDIKFDFIKTKHPVETYAIRATSGNKKFIYSSDTAYFEELIEFSKNADLFLCEVGILSKDKNEEILHLTPQEASDIANKAKVKRLVLTHFYPGYKSEAIRTETLNNYNSIFELSQEMKAYFI